MLRKLCPHKKSLTAQPAAKPDYAYESGCAKVEGDETKGTVTLFIEVETEPLTVTLASLDFEGVLLYLDSILHAARRHR